MNKQSIVDKVNQIRSELLALAKQIRNLPPNPNAAPIGEGCFSIKLNELAKHDKWSPDYHIFSPQYNIIAKMIETYPIDEVLVKLNQIIETKRYYLKGNMIMFHPEVIKNLKTLID